VHCYPEEYDLRSGYPPARHAYGAVGDYGHRGHASQQTVKRRGLILHERHVPPPGGQGTVALRNAMSDWKGTVSVSYGYL
jgi:hypothetical protein